MESEVVISTVIDPREHAAVREALAEATMLVLQYRIALLETQARLEKVTRYSRGGPGITD